MDNIKLTDINPEQGLTSGQVQQQIESGNKNTAEKSLTKSVKEILATNIFTLFNLINIILGALVFYTGSYKNLLFLGIAIINTIIGIIQEIRSKRQVDKMVLLAEGRNVVIRDGKENELLPEDIVLGDIVELSRGDQVPVDGKVVLSKSMQVDESQITGEAKTITKQPEDEITSGSYLVGGSGRMLVTKVGNDTFVNHLSDEARQGKDAPSILLNTINRIIKALSIVIVPLGVILFVVKLYQGLGIDRSILGTVAAMIGMIPEGLVLLTSMTLAVSAMTLARKRTLVRDLPAIETLARVDTICLDKTGTITSGELKFEQIIPLDEKTTMEQLQKMAATITYGTGDNNETAMAIKNQFADPKVPVTSVEAFSSERKWSGVEVAGEGAYILGAPQFIEKNISQEIQSQINNYAQDGKRVLAIAKAEKLTTDKPLDNPQVLGLLLISDVIRPNANNTFAYFSSQDVDIKVISGDDPITVSSIAKNAGIKKSDKFIDMSQVTEADNFGKLVTENTVFGRVTPDQKKQLINGLQENKHTVAMTGDGVNDILALRQADCGIAMASGSESTKSIADFVLIDSNFDAMIGVLKEGRRVINNIQRVAAMYLIKTMYSVALAILFMFFQNGYPFEPIQLTPITTLMVGIPSFVLALQPNFQKITNQFMRQVLIISAPAATCIVGYIVIIQGIGALLGLNYRFTSTLSVLITGSICWLALVLVSRPFNRMKIALDFGVLAAFLLILVFFNNIFSLVSLFNPWVWWISIPLILTAYPIYIFSQGVISKILDARSRRRARKQA
ncbi:HAD-IC family P-type ATPase [Lentilactobacillus sp. SPB1-3]|uniref:HAD-IC family P-type ATPase n=1 Tax=Lentilactobacillus terminaliae TaxID=3003483 RepID=A0ACD5DF95_9LACO|nr:HAD-IC family P-type ATPase [Lentilactobacillus sp. SPB1-3]MCZ0977609.1 HAD-IC family P-type ATPase [Lentilactobacillus sp. SPB1-3]